MEELLDGEKEGIRTEAGSESTERIPAMTHSEEQDPMLENAKHKERERRTPLVNHGHDTLSSRNLIEHINDHTLLLTCLSLLIVLVLYAVSSVFVVWGSLLVIFICIGVYRNTIKRERFYRQFYLDYQNIIQNVST